MSDKVPIWEWKDYDYKQACITNEIVDEDGNVVAYGVNCRYGPLIAKAPQLSAAVQALLPLAVELWGREAEKADYSGWQRPSRDVIDAAEKLLDELRGT